MSRVEESWINWTCRLSDCLAAVEIMDRSDALLPLEQGVIFWHDMATDMSRQGGCLYLVGNGASSSMCSHFGADLNKNAAMRTQVFTDSALLTAVANDISFERVFAEPLMRMGEARDMLLTISSSGNSPNILAAIGVAREKGMKVVTLSGMSRDNRSRFLGDLNIYVPESTYGLVETAHAALLHYWADLLVASAKSA